MATRVSPLTQLAHPRPAGKPAAPALSPLPRRRTIHTQGDLDGACYLYSLANAYTQLTGRPPRLERWAKAVREVPHPVDFLDGTVGTTGAYQDNPQLLVEAGEILLRHLAGGNAVPKLMWHPEVTTYAAVAELIDDRGVCLLRYTGDSHWSRDLDHWVVGVASRKPEPANPPHRKPLRLYVACSSRYTDVLQDHLDDGGGRYEERQHEPAGRRSNDWLDDDGSSRLFPGWVIRVERPRA